MSANVASKRQKIIDRCEKIIVAKTRNVVYCPATLKSAVPATELDTFLNDEDCQNEFIHAHMQWLLRHIDNGDFHHTVLVREQIRKFQKRCYKNGTCVNWSRFVFSDSIKKQFLKRRKDNFIVFLKKDCLCFEHTN